VDPTTSSSSITSKGQVTIPKALRQQLGLARGSRVSFQLVRASGFGLLRSRRPPVPVDFDPASLLRPLSGIGGRCHDAASA
jgi:AbrB family looped-hinge helix DNA binding protein